jgi:hypothetical protein
VLSCGHLTCVECIAPLFIGKFARCPLCRVKIDLKSGQVMTVTIKTPKAERPVNAELETGQDVERYGSKIFEFVKFTQRTLEKDSESKIILFIQFNRFVTGDSNRLD